MKRASVVSALLLSLAASQAAFGGFDFTYTAPGGAIPNPGLSGSPTEGVSVFPLFMSDFPGDTIQTLELELTGLTHTAPWDLDVYLIDPFGNAIRIISDRGDMSAVADLTMIFNDDGSVLPADPDTPLATGPWKPEMLTDGTPPGVGLNDFTMPGTDAWILLIVDDTAGNNGSLDSWTLRGTIPEPVTLSLLAIGALTTLRRRFAR
jgi:hypothetical protein